LEIYTIGFTQKPAAEFFDTLRAKGIRQLIDVRLNNVSQLSGYSKQEDLKYFLRELVRAEYFHLVELAPTQDMLQAYRSKKIDWVEYEMRYLDLLDKRSVERSIDPSIFSTPTVLLCSEPTQARCHRRLLVEYLDQKWGDVSSIPL
jgi:uncharacterized protein (DUF488 family)